MISMALATLFVPFLPLLAKQILLNNFLSDFPSMAISTDNVDPGAVDRPQRWDINEIQLFMLVFGLISTAFDFTDVCAVAGILPGRRGAVPDRVVRGVAADGARGGAGAAHAFAVLAEPAEPAADRLDGGGRRAGDIFALSRSRGARVRLRATAAAASPRGYRDRGALCLGDRIGQAALLPGVAGGKGRTAATSRRHTLELGDYSPFAPTARTTFPNFSVSATMNAANSSGESDASATAP